MAVCVTDERPCPRGRNAKLFGNFSDGPLAQTVHLESLSRPLWQFGERLMGLDKALPRIDDLLGRRGRVCNVGRLFIVKGDRLDQGFTPLMVETKITGSLIEIGFGIVVLRGVGWRRRNHAQESILREISGRILIDTAAMQGLRYSLGVTPEQILYVPTQLLPAFHSDASKQCRDRSPNQ